MERTRLWKAYLLVGMVLIATHFTFSTGFAQNVDYEVIGLSAAVAGAVGIRRNRPEHALGWWLIIAGQLCFVIGDLTWNIIANGFHQSPTPSLADVAYVAGYPLIMAGLAIMIRSRAPRRSWGPFIDAVVVGSAAAAAIWILIIDKYESGLFHDAAATVAAVYPAFDVLIIGLLARLLFAPGPRTGAYRLLVGAMAGLLVGDVLYAALLANDQDLARSPWSAGWLLGYILLGAAALHPSMARAFVHRDDSHETGTLTAGRLTVLGMVAATPYAAIAVQLAIGGTVSTVEAMVFSGLIFSLVVVRATLLLRSVDATNGHLAAMEVERRELMKRLVEVGEDERGRLAATLHDGPIQQLTAVQIRMHRVTALRRRGLEVEAEKVLSDIGDALTTQIADLRQTMAELRPPALDERGLPEAIRDHALSLRIVSDLDYVVDSQLGVRPMPEIETTLYRIAQEAMMNAAKHAGAGRVVVTLVQDGSGVNLEVVDNGRGFRTDGVGAGSELWHHYGIATMRERVHALGGTFAITSSVGHGTTVRATLPNAFPAATIGEVMVTGVR